jgi:hypothetical protein
MKSDTAVIAFDGKKLAGLVSTRACEGADRRVCTVKTISVRGTDIAIAAYGTARITAEVERWLTLPLGQQELPTYHYGVESYAALVVQDSGAFTILPSGEGRGVCAALFGWQLTSRLEMGPLLEAPILWQFADCGYRRSIQTGGLDAVVALKSIRACLTDERGSSVDAVDVAHIFPGFADG